MVLFVRILVWVGIKNGRVGVVCLIDVGGGR